MPIYEYLCQKCRAHTEILQKITDKPLVKCRKCGGRLEKQWSQSGFQFKGSGWYVTDYAGKQGGNKEEKTGTESEAKSAEAKSADKAATTDTVTTKKTAGKKSASSSKAKGD